MAKVTPLTQVLVLMLKTARIGKIFALTCSVLLVVGLLFLYPPKNTIFVSPGGDDQNNGTRKYPVQTIQRGVDLAKNGGDILIEPGMYRETITVSGTNPLVIRANNSKDKHVILSGSEPSSRLDWRQCNERTCPHINQFYRTHVYVTSLPWSEIPTIVTEKTPDGTIHNLPLARSPNELIQDPNKYHEFWWQATGQGQSVNSLADTNHLIGNPDVKGGRIFIMDGADRCGTFLYTRAITDHNRVSGTISVDQPIGALTYGTQETGVSEYSKYFIDNVIGYLDAPGEWVYDQSDHKLYLWPLGEKDPKTLTIEIGRRATGIYINQSNIEIDGVTITHINDHDDFDYPTGAIVISPHTDIANVTLRNISSSYTGNGILGKPSDAVIIRNIVITNAYFYDVSKSPIAFVGSVNRPKSITGITIENSDITRSGFPFNESAIRIQRASRIYLRNNSIHDTASYGIHITGYEKSDTSVDSIIVSHNTIERACQNASGCAGLKFFGGKFTRTMARNNVIRDTLGWSYCQQARERYPENGIGIFISNASNIRLLANKAIRNDSAGYLLYLRQIPTVDNVIMGNLAEQSREGILLQVESDQIDAPAQGYALENTRIVRNILRGNQTALSVEAIKPQPLRIIGNILDD